MSKDGKAQKGPGTISPTPLRDWLARQTAPRKVALVLLFAALIACGGKAAFRYSLSPVPATQQLLFVIASGALLGSRLGSVASLGYLVAASLLPGLWPDYAGATPLTGPLAGYLWSLPLAAYLSGYFVDRARSELAAIFAIGACAAIAVFDGLGSLRLAMSMGGGGAEAFVKGAGLFVGLHAAQGSLAVLIASTASSTLRMYEQK